MFAAGDCVETRHLVTGEPVAIALGTHANKQGRVVGINATGGDATFPGVHRHRGDEGLRRTRSARTGLTEHEARDGRASTRSPPTIDAHEPGGVLPGVRGRSG